MLAAFFKYFSTISSFPILYNFTVFSTCYLFFLKPSWQTFSFSPYFPDVRFPLHLLQQYFDSFQLPLILSKDPRLPFRQADKLQRTWQTLKLLAQSHWHLSQYTQFQNNIIGKKFLKITSKTCRAFPLWARAGRTGVSETHTFYSLTLSKLCM